MEKANLKFSIYTAYLLIFRKITENHYLLKYLFSDYYFAQI